MLEKLKFNYNESYNQCNTFTPREIYCLRRKMEREGC